MKDVANIIKMIREIQNNCENLISLEKNTEVSYKKEVKKVENESAQIIENMISSIDAFESKNLFAIKEKMIPVVELLRVDYKDVFDNIKKDFSYGEKSIEENGKLLNTLIKEYNECVSELNGIDFDTLVPKTTIRMVGSEKFEVTQGGNTPEVYTCDDPPITDFQSLPLNDIAKRIFVVYKNVESCIDAIRESFEQEFNIKEFESYVKSSSEAWLSEKRGRDKTEFEKQIEEFFTGETVQSKHKSFFDSMEESGKLSEVDTESGTLEYKQTITIGTTKLLVANEKDKLHYINLSPVLNRYLSNGFLTAPVILDLVNQGNILFNLYENEDDYSKENAQFINQIILQFLLSFPVGRLHLWLIDPDDKMKFKYSMLNNVADGILHGNTIIKNYKGLENAISDLKGIMDEITDNKLNQNDVENIFEYNQKFEALKQDVNLLVFVDYPNGINKQIAKELRQIMANGNRAGIFTLLTNNIHNECLDYMYKESDRNEFISWAQKNALTINSIGEGLKIGYVEIDNSFTPKTSINMDIFKQVIETLKSNKEFTKTKPVPMSQMFEAGDQEATNTNNVAKVLDIPIGIRGAEIQTLKLDASGNGNPHAVVIGGTGSGKSILLHTIILSACYKYSPKDLNFYLIDFKGGREFEFYQANNVVENQLPHIKLTGLTSDVEDGLAILQNLEIELQRRNRLFDEKGVQDIIQYRETGGTMPRLFVIVDEIQELFEKDEKLGQRAIAILRRLFKLGRAYGISILWASQNIPKVVSLKDQVLSQIGNRISLKLNNPDEAIDIGIDSKKVRALNRPEKGLGVINDVRLGNNSEEFRVAFAEDDLIERTKFVKTILEKWKHIERDNKPLYIVGSGTEPSPIAEGTIFSQQLTKADMGSKSYKSYKVQFGDNYINGEPFLIDLPVINENKTNIFFMGTDIELLRDMMGYALLSITKEHITNSDYTGKNDKIIYANGEMYNPKDSKDLYNVVRDDFVGYINDVSPASKFKEAVQNIYKEYRNRVKAADTVGLKGIYSPLFFVVHAIQRYADLFNSNPKLILKESVGNEIDSTVNSGGKDSYFAGGNPFISTSSISSEEKDSIQFTDAVKELIERGGQFGVHFVISIDAIDSLGQYSRMSDCLKTIKYKVFTKGISANKISEIMGSSYGSFYNITNSKIVLLTYQDVVAKIWAYRYDDDKDSSWYKNLSKNYLSIEE